jgi:dephospho-CoA kinase
VARVWRGLGAEVLDTDEVAHVAMRPGGPSHGAVVARFGPAVCGPGGAIDRRRLGAIVFGDERAREDLNRLVHPEVFARVSRWRADCRQRGVAAVVVIPLLFEVGAADGWTAVVAVVAGQETVRQRLRARGLTDAEAAQRLAAQLPVEEKARRADYVIRNDGDLEGLEHEACRERERTA